MATGVTATVAINPTTITTIPGAIINFPATIASIQVIVTNRNNGRHQPR